MADQGTVIIKFADGLQTSLWKLSLSILCRHVTGGYVDWYGPGHVLTEPKLCSAI